jgi:hypothetical protein
MNHHDDDSLRLPFFFIHVIHNDKEEEYSSPRSRSS